MQRWVESERERASERAKERIGENTACAALDWKQERERARERE